MDFGCVWMLDKNVDQSFVLFTDTFAQEKIGHSYPNKKPLPLVQGFLFVNVPIIKTLTPKVRV